MNTDAKIILTILADRVQQFVERIIVYGQTDLIPGMVHLTFGNRCNSL